MSQKVTVIKVCPGSWLAAGAGSSCPLPPLCSVNRLVAHVLTVHDDLVPTESEELVNHMLTPVRYFIPVIYNADQVRST
jgi:hypothetical protein